MDNRMIYNSETWTGLSKQTKTSPAAMRASPAAAKSPLFYKGIGFLLIAAAAAVFLGLFGRDAVFNKNASELDVTETIPSSLRPMDPQPSPSVHQEDGAGKDSQAVIEKGSPLSIIEETAGLPGVSEEAHIKIASRSSSVVSEREPASFLFMGDSIAGDLWRSFYHMFRPYKFIHIDNISRHSTGLARYEQWDYLEKLQAQLVERHYDLVVISAGLNDYRSIVNPEDRSRIAYRSTEWKAIYQSRIRALIAEVRKTGGNMIWLGPPTVTEAKDFPEIQFIDQTMKEAVEQEGELYLSLWDLSSDQNGKYAVILKGADAMRPMRAADGIHFTREGNDFIARWVFDRGKGKKAKLDAIAALIEKKKSSSPPFPVPEDASN